MGGSSHSRSIPAVVILLVLSYLACGLGAPAAADAAVRKAPYLIYSGVNTEMRVQWQTTVTEPCTIEWGTDTGYSLGNVGTSEYGADHQHAFTITNLVPGVLYHYRVIVGGSEYAGSFHAAPSGGATDVKFIAYGDTRSYPADHDKVAARVMAHCAADPDLQTFVLSVGDLVYNGDNEADWDAQFFSASYPNIRHLLADLPYSSCKGNHEQTGAGFAKYFPYPFVAGRYWSFDYGPAHFAIVDQYTPYGTGSEQLDWLVADLSGTDRPWKFVCLHEPGWSAGGGHPNNTSVQTYLEPLFESEGVAIVFGGHNHYYARASVNGVEHLTVGGGGAPLHTPVLSYPYVVTATRAYSHCEIKIEGGTLELEAYTYADSLIDSLTIVLPDASVPRSESPGAGGILIDAVSPNPLVEGSVVSFLLPADEHVQAAVYDLEGRRIANLADAADRAGRHEVRWDGRDSSGRRVAPGVYLLRLESSRGNAASKIVVLR